jgi:hypothetical protein
VVGQSEQAVAADDVRLEPLVAAGCSAEAGRGAREVRGRDDRPRPADARLLAVRLDEQREQPKILAPVVRLPHPELERGEPLRREVTAPARVGR